jgi:hypothetical protein
VVVSPVLVVSMRSRSRQISTTSSAAVPVSRPAAGALSEVMSLFLPARGFGDRPATRYQLNPAV